MGEAEASPTAEPAARRVRSTGWTKACRARLRRAWPAGSEATEVVAQARAATLVAPHPAARIGAAHTGALPNLDGTGDADIPAMHALHSGRAPGFLSDRRCTPRGRASTGAVIAQSQAEPASPNTVVAAPPEEVFSPASQELSPWSMFLNADWIVKAIMVGLAFASLITWTTSWQVRGTVHRQAASRQGVAVGLPGPTRWASSYEELRSDRSVMRTFIATAINESRCRGT